MTDKRVHDADDKTVHIVPGIAYKLHPDVDLLAELGIGVNDDASQYVSVGVAFYVR